ncbi:PilZ domain-containing protein [Ramlibacter sp. PS3R-8]|uniref:PilZ domain-containing protein n=1 Tax=Ramlibacter sp. PS3R-8 TaxID=3133437 RepID=UPI0030AA95E7
MQANAVTIQVPLQRREERRSSDRYVASMPVQVNGEDSTTHDLSAGGLSFVADRSYDVGARIDVVVEYILDGHHYPLRCQAQVVRVQASGTAFTIGARLLPETRLPDVPEGGPDHPPRPLRRVA